LCSIRCRAIVICVPFFSSSFRVQGKGTENRKLKKKKNIFKEFEKKSVDRIAFLLFIFL